MIAMSKLTWSTACLLFAASVWGVETVPSQVSTPSRPLVVLVGPPLSGKTTFLEAIQRRYGLPGVSIEDLIKEHAVELRRNHPSGISIAELRDDPAMSRYLRSRLETLDLNRGAALDGFPASRMQAEELEKMITERKLNAIMLQLEIPDDVVRQRAAKGGRQSDQPKVIEQRIKDYHREFDTIALYFPNAKIVKINGNESEEKMWKAMQQALDQWGLPVKQGTK
jgi:adenylate kinase